MTKPDAEAFLDHFDALAVPIQSAFHKISEDGVQPPLHVFSYQDTPEPGSLTAFTYGLSLVPHSSWKFGRPELVISVSSQDLAWALAMGEIAYRLRGQCPFCYGNTIRFGTAVSDESEMSAFVVFAPTIMDRNEATVELTQWKIHVAQLYPIYEKEVSFIESDGLQAFFSHAGVDYTDVRRPLLTG